MIFEAIIIVFSLITLGAYWLHTCYNHIEKQMAAFQKGNIPDIPEVQDPLTMSNHIGAIPSWLKGVVYCIGPGKFNIDLNDGTTFAIKHAFDGMPYIHRLEVNGETQTVKYNSRLTSQSLVSRMEKNPGSNPVYFSFIPRLSFFEWVKFFVSRLDIMILRPTKNSKPSDRQIGITVTPNFILPASHTNREKTLVAKTDANMLQKVNSETLIPEALFAYDDYNPSLTGPLSSAHHQEDPYTRETFNVVVALLPRPKIKVFSISEKGKATVLANITHRFDGSKVSAPYIHSFFLTENYVIIPECPLKYGNYCKNLIIMGSVISTISWDDHAPVYFHVIQRKNPKLVASIPAPPFFQFHTVNAFETIEGDDIILNLDCCAFDNADILYKLHTLGAPHEKGDPMLNDKHITFNGIKLSQVHQQAFGNLTRHQLNLTQHKLESVQKLCPNFDFPRFNQKYTFQNHQYVFGAVLLPFNEEREESIGITKVDIFNRTTMHYFNNGYICSEPIFAPHPNATSEDEGVLLTVANGKGGCYLTILDASNLAELSQTKISDVCTTTFHGSFVDLEFKSVNIN